MISKMRPDEMPLAKDHCLMHKGPVAFYGELNLSSQRLIFSPKGKVDKLAGIREISIPIEDIDHLKIVGFEKHLTIKVGKKSYRFSGRGAHRIHDRLDIQLRSINGEAINLADIDMLNERVVLQGDVDVYLKGRLHTTGQLILTAQRLHIESLPSLETMLFSQKSLSSPIHDLKLLNYEPISKRLKIETKEESITIGGSLTSDVFLFLESIKDGDFNGNREILDCTFFHGQVHIHGALLQTSKRILFCPKGRLDSIAGANAISIHLSKISNIHLTGWPDQQLCLKMLNGNQHLFACKDATSALNNLIGGLSSFPTQPLFKDSRDGAKGATKTKRRLARIGVNVGKEEIQLVEWSVRIIEKGAIQMGWILLTNECCRFISIEKGVVLSKDVTQINKTRFSRDYDPVLKIQSDDEMLTFVPQGGTQFNKTFWSMLMGIKPEQEGKIGRPGQGINRVVGKFRYLNIFKGDKKVMGLTNVVVLKRPQGLRIELEKMEKTPIKMGDTLIIEVPRNEGRFKYTSNVTECYIVEPDPIGRHYITLEKPTDIIVFNQRTAFRVHFVKQGLICCFVTDPEKSPGDFRLLRNVQSKDEKASAIQLMNTFSVSSSEQNEEVEEKEKIADFVSADGLNSLGILTCRFFDLSLGGCSFVMNQDLSISLAKQSTKLIFKLVIPFETGDLSILARLVGVRKNVDKPKDFIHGCQFFNVNKTAASRLKREIIRLEREHIRELLQSEASINN